MPNLAPGSPRSRRYHVATGSQDWVWQNGQSTLLAIVVADLPDGKQLLSDDVRNRRWLRAATSSQDWVWQNSQLTLLTAAPEDLPPGLGPDTASRSVLFARAQTRLRPDWISTGWPNLLIGQDTIYGDPGQVPVYDLSPPPKGRRHPIALRTHIDGHVNDTLLGQDTVYGAPGQVPTYDWPLPHGKPYPVALRVWQNDNSNNTLVPADLPPGLGPTEWKPQERKLIPREPAHKGWISGTFIPLLAEIEADAATLPRRNKLPDNPLRDPRLKFRYGYTFTDANLLYVAITINLKTGVTIARGTRTISGSYRTVYRGTRNI